MIEDAWYASLLVCPDCHGPMRFEGGGASCDSCTFRSDSERDLRPKAPPRLSVQMDRLLSFDPESAIRHLETRPPIVEYSGPAAIRDSRELMSEIQHHLRQPGRLLDLGCGPKDQKACVEHIGHSYVGVDFDSTAADLLADAHALPFRTASFDCVLSYAVLEHLHNPTIAISEVARVLRSGGVFVGTVSLGEPFHQSFFHMTSWGLVSLLSASKVLTPVRLWPTIDTLRSLQIMGRYSRVIRLFLGCLHFANTFLPFLTPRKMMWPVQDRQIDALHRAGSVGFVVRKN